MEQNSNATNEGSTTPAPITVFLDHNAWHFLFERGLNPCVELPKPDFILKITREGEFEIDAIPASMVELRGFIQQSRSQCIDTHMYFGFSEMGEDPSESRVGGFDVGFWASEEEIKFISSQRELIGTEKKISTRLYPHEADISLAARSLRSVVLSCDKGGALKRVSKQGGRVVNLNKFDDSKLSLKDFVLASVNEIARKNVER